MAALNESLGRNYDWLNDAESNSEGVQGIQHLAAPVKDESACNHFTYLGDTTSCLCDTCDKTFALKVRLSLHSSVYSANRSKASRIGANSKTRKVSQNDKITSEEDSPREMSDPKRNLPTENFDKEVMEWDKSITYHFKSFQSERRRNRNRNSTTTNHNRNISEESEDKTVSDEMGMMTCFDFSDIVKQL